MAISTTTEIAGPVDVVFQQTLLRNAKAVCPYLVGSTPGDVLASHEGSFTVKWRRIENLTPTTTALTELTGNFSLPTRTGTQPTVTDITAVVQKYGDFIQLTEEADLINFNGQNDKLVEVLGIQAGKSLNRLQRNILEDNATLIRASGAAVDGNVGDVISADLIRNAANQLNRNSALKFTSMTLGSVNINTSPVRDAYWGICHSDVEEDIRLIQGFIASERYGGQTEVAKNEFGAVGPIRWITTEEASVDADLGAAPGGVLRSTTGASADLYTSIIFGRDAHGALSLDIELIREIYMAGDDIPGIILISKEKGSAGSGDPLNEIATLGWKTWHAGAIQNSTWIRGLRTAATKLT